MKGYSFFAEMPESRKSKSASKAFPFQPWTRETLRGYAAKGLHVNCIAVVKGTERLGDLNGHKRDVHFDVIAPVSDYNNAQVCTASATDGYLRARAVRIDEDLARKLHPALFNSGLL